MLRLRLFETEGVKRLSRTRASMLAGATEVSPIIPGIIPFGLVCGAAVTGAGLGLPEAVAMSLFVNAGASQLAATTLFTEGTPLAIALTTSLIINARLFIYATSIAPYIANGKQHGRWLLGHPLVDQSYAAVMTSGRFRDDISIVPYYVGSWLILALVWQAANIAGALLGPIIPPEWSLDFAVPLVFLAMLVPAIAERIDAETAAVTAVAAAILVPALPMQLGLLASILIGMAWGAVRDSNEETADE